MGKGDIRTRRGKIWRGTTGKRRKKKGKTKQTSKIQPKPDKSA